MNQRILRQAEDQFKTLSNLSNNEIENEIINFIEGGANLVSLPFLVFSAEMSCV